jgi:hypothetical protein
MGAPSLVCVGNDHKTTLRRELGAVLSTGEFAVCTGITDTASIVLRLTTTLPKTLDEMEGCPCLMRSLMRRHPIVAKLFRDRILPLIVAYTQRGEVIMK